MGNEISDLANIDSPTLWTIGHSTRTWEDFQQLLLSNQILSLVDVRSYPGSRRYPHFNQAQLATDLSAIGIAYHHFKSLGGRRKPLPGSRHTAWRNASFRAYADHMDEAEFKQGIHNLLQLAQKSRTTIMCAEAVWWRCHRSLIADYLKAKGVSVLHIIDAAHVESHPYTTAARIVNGELSYEGLLPG